MLQCTEPVTIYRGAVKDFRIGHWFALKVKPRHEKTVATSLEAKGYKQLVPLYRCARRWSDRIKVLELPLFPGYAFCRFEFADRLKVLQTPGVLGIVTIGKAPAPVRDDEIQAIATIVSSQVPAEPAVFLRTGQSVFIIKGPLAGVRGFLQEIRNKRSLVVSVTLLQRSVAVELNTDSVVAVGSNRTAPEMVRDGEDSKAGMLD